MPGERPDRIGAHILGTHVDVGLLQHAHRIGEVHVGRKYRDVHLPFGFHALAELAEQSLVGRARSMHFPVTGDHGTTHAHTLGP